MTNIKRVQREIAVAESELEKVIGLIKAMPRAEKVTVSKVVDEAFQKLRAAKTRLEDLEELLKAVAPRP